MGNNTLVSQVLETSAGRAPDMTHALCSLGKGDMGAGIVALWNAGQINGMIRGASITTLIFSLGIGVSMMFLHRHHENKTSSTKLSEKRLMRVWSLQHPFMNSGAINVPYRK